MKKGKVYLVGAGPGDIDLLTLKGKKALEQADMIVYDRLANPKLLDFARPDCELIYGGKLPKKHILRQDQLNQLLIDQASAGKTVVRLKGGDPGVFGRVGEEAEALAEQAVPFEIVPGITSGIAAPAYAGIPVTHREFGTSFAVVTAHGRAASGEPVIDWEAVKGIDTVAFYMGVGNLPYICKNLIRHGKPGATPVALIQWGTYSRQRVVEGTLETIAGVVQKAGLTNPAIILVGPVVTLRQHANWFESKPLFGRQILLARTSNGTSRLAEQLADRGADVVSFPRWQRVALHADSAILRKIGDYHSVFFASPDSVEDFFRLLTETGADIRQLNARLYAGSRKSQQRLQTAGLQAHIAEDYRMLDGKLLFVGEKLLDFPSGEVLQHPDGDVLWTAKKQIDSHHLPILELTLQEFKPDTILFPNSASVLPFLEGLKMAGFNDEDFVKSAKVGCLGRQTEKTLATLGIRVDYLPEAAKIEDLAEELLK